MSFQRVIVLGNIGRNPELTHMPNGTAVAKFSVAANEQWKDKNGQKQEHTEWFNVVTFGRQAELCAQYLTKGRQVLIEGTLRTREYTDDKGNKRYFTDLRAQNIQFVGGKPTGGGEGGPVDGPYPPAENDDDIPF